VINKYDEGKNPPIGLLSRTGNYRSSAGFGDVLSGKITVMTYPIHLNIHNDLVTVATVLTVIRQAL